MASMAESTVAYPVIMITSHEGLNRRLSSRILMPSTFSILRSVSTTSKRPLFARSNPLGPVSAVTMS